MLNNQRYESLKKLKKTLLEDREKLNKLKKISSNKHNKIDISNIYVFQLSGINHFVRFEYEDIELIDEWYPDYIINGYKTKFIDIFSNSVIYESNNVHKVKNRVFDPNTDEYIEIFKLKEVGREFFPKFSNEVSMDLLERINKRINFPDVYGPRLVKSF